MLFNYYYLKYMCGKIYMDAIVHMIHIIRFFEKNTQRLQINNANFQQIILIQKWNFLLK